MTRGRRGKITITHEMSKKRKGENFLAMLAGKIGSKLGQTRCFVWFKIHNNNFPLNGDKQ